MIDVTRRPARRVKLKGVKGEEESEGGEERKERKEEPRRGMSVVVSGAMKTDWVVGEAEESRLNDTSGVGRRFWKVP